MPLKLQVARLPEPPPGLPHDEKARTRLAVEWACCEADVQQAQRLRYEVFATEMGARLTPLAGTMPGLDSDRFDAFCDHLLVRAVNHENDAPGMLVGTYRVLPPDAARRAGGLYIDTEFDLAPLQDLRAKAVELGRSCVHPDWRSGGVIMALWSALCRYMYLHQLETMIGCASMGVEDGGHAAARLWLALRHSHLAAEPWRAVPKNALPLKAHDDSSFLTRNALRDAATPPLIRGYLRCGARLLGPPSVDEAFKTADLPMLLRIDDLVPRYRRYFLGN